MKTLKNLTLWILLLAVAPLQAAGTGPLVGDTAPDFTLKDLDGNTVRLADLRKRGAVLIVFFSTRCHVCHGMIPQFKATWKKYRQRGVQLVAVDIGWESQADVEAYAMENDLPYPVLNDDEQKRGLVEAWRLIGTPTIQLVARNGKVLYRGHRLPPIDRLLARR